MNKITFSPEPRDAAPFVWCWCWWTLVSGKVGLMNLIKKTTNKITCIVVHVCHAPNDTSLILWSPPESLTCTDTLSFPPEPLRSRCVSPFQRQNGPKKCFNASLEKERAGVRRARRHSSRCRRVSSPLVRLFFSFSYSFPTLTFILIWIVYVCIQQHSHHQHGRWWKGLERRA